MGNDIQEIKDALLEGEEEVKEEVAEEETTEEEPETKEEGEEKPEGDGGPKQPEKTEKPVLTPELQAYLDEKIEARLARDRKANYVRQLETVLGMPLEQAIPYLQKEREASLQRQAAEYAEKHGLSEELAKEFLQTRGEVERMRYEQARIVRDNLIASQKAALSKEPFFAELAPEVERLIEENPTVDFETAFHYLRGQKLPELLKRHEAAIEQRVLSSINNRKKTKVESDTSAGEPQGSITEKVRNLAKTFDLPAKELAKHYKRGG